MSWYNALQCMADGYVLEPQTNPIYFDYKFLNYVLAGMKVSGELSVCVLDGGSQMMHIIIRDELLEYATTETLLSSLGNVVAPAQYVTFGASKYPLYFGPVNDILSYVKLISPIKNDRCWFMDIGLVPSIDNASFLVGSPIGGKVIKKKKLHRIIVKL